jgi:IS30 family transposase
MIGRLRLEGEQTVCAKTVYNWLQRGYIAGFAMKRKQRKLAMRNVAYKNPTAKRIDERPQEANERASGHWEMDLVVSGAGKAGSLLVFTERASRQELIHLLPDKKQSSVIAVLDTLERRYKSNFKKIFKTITCDNGSEFLNSDGLEQSSISKGKRTEVYYAHPYSSWERGSNENANKLIRKFIPKGEDISKLPVAYIKRIEKWMNNYPRRIFGYKTANEARIA